MTGGQIVLLHGCGGSVESTFVTNGWLDALEAIGRRSVPIRLPGHGSRSPSRDPATYADLAGTVATQLPPGRFDAVGFSLGAKLLLELALRLPERIDRLVLGGVGDNVFAPEGVAAAAALALERGPTAETPPAVRAFLETFEPERNDPLVIAAVLRRPPNPTFTPERLADVRAAVLVVNGADDPLLQLGGRLFTCIPGVVSLTLPGVDHFRLPQQKAFIRHAVDFLERHGTHGNTAQRSSGGCAA